jgi:hypothetical protein
MHLPDVRAQGLLVRRGLALLAAVPVGAAAGLWARSTGGEAALVGLLAAAAALVAVAQQTLP